MELRQHDCLALPPGHWLLILEDLLVVQRRVNSGQRRLASALLAVPLFGLTACPSNPSDPPPIEYQCGTTDPPASVPAGEACGAGDPNLPPEPALPTDVCQELAANKSFPDENNLDTSRVQTALAACKGRAVKLVADGDNNVFITSTIASTASRCGGQWGHALRVPKSRALSKDWQLRHRRGERLGCLQ